MKNLFASVFLIGLTIFSNSQEAKEVKSSIKEVTVFLSGAQISRSGSVTLDAGTNTIKFVGLSPGLNANSIQVGSNKELTIVSVNTQRNYLTDKKLSPRINELNDSLEDMRFKLDLRRKHKTVYELERDMLISNKSIGGQNEGVDIEDLMEMADFYRARMKDIELKLLDINEEEKNLNETIRRLQQQLNSQNALAKRNTTEVLVNVSSKSRTTAKINLSYFVNNAYWIPSYDIRSKESNGPITLTYKGNVYQNTGNDWEDVKVTLSTGNPNQNNTKPNVYPWVLAFQNVYSRYDGNKKYKRTLSNAMYEVAEAEEPMAMDDEAGAFDLSSNTIGGTVTQTTVNTEFKIAIPYTVKSNGLANVIDIKDHKLETTYKYYTAPKFDKDAFLLGKVTGWNNLNLMSGDANTYYQGTYIGKSYLNATATTDTLDISLGRDKSIVVNRKKIKEFCKNSTIGANKKTTLGMEITVRNGKTIPISILVEDQIPISKTKEIEVKTIEISGADYEENSGSLKWNLDLQPGETKVLQLKYEVKYPKDKTISNL